MFCSGGSLEYWSTYYSVLFDFGGDGTLISYNAGGGKRNRTRTHATVIGRSGAARSESRQGMQTGWRKGDKIQYNVQYI
jgi:hypothetical protein